MSFIVVAFHTADLIHKNAIIKYILSRNKYKVNVILFPSASSQSDEKIHCGIWSDQWWSSLACMAICTPPAQHGTLRMFTTCSSLVPKFKLESFERALGKLKSLSKCPGHTIPACCEIFLWETHLSTRCPGRPIKPLWFLATRADSPYSNWPD